MHWNIRKVNGGYWLYKEQPDHALRDEDVWVFKEWIEVVDFLYHQVHEEAQAIYERGK